MPHDPCLGGGGGKTAAEDGGPASLLAAPCILSVAALAAQL